MEFAPWPYFEEDEIQAAVNVLRSGKINQWTGDEVTSFEKEYARYVGADYAVAIANGSLALDLALRALGIGKGDEVIVTPRSFIASVSCVALAGAVPVFVDVDPDSQNITADHIAPAITPKTKAVIAVHLAGWPCELDKIKRLCVHHGLALVEDCAQAHGAVIQGQNVGSVGDCAVFSFCQDKIMTTGGEGGMLVTCNQETWEKVWSYKDHGRSYTRVFDRTHAPGFKWLAGRFGTNCRMTEMQAAIGRVALKKLDRWVEKRRSFASRFNDAFKTIPGLRVAVPGEAVYHSYYKYYFFIDPDALKQGWTRAGILETLNKQKIPCNTGICPEIYLEKAFQNYPYRLFTGQKRTGGQRLPAARQLGETSMMLMVHPTLTLESVQFVIDQVRQVMEKAVR